MKIILVLLLLVSPALAAPKKTITGARLQGCRAEGCMGTVKDTVYIKCFWPVLDAPMKLFAEGSTGIEVEGPPTPRNIIFPAGTVFLNGTRSDVFFTAAVVNKPVPVEKEFQDSVFVDGSTRTVTYKKTVNENKDVREITEIATPPPGTAAK
jgi:hypothetical protein